MCLSLFVCVLWGEALEAVMKSFNFISIIFHCQLLPFRQVCLSSVQLEVNEVEILSFSFQSEPPVEQRPRRLPMVTEAVSKLSPNLPGPD